MRKMSRTQARECLPLPHTGVPFRDQVSLVVDRGLKRYTSSRSIQCARGQIKPTGTTSCNHSKRATIRACLSCQMSTRTLPCLLLRTDERECKLKLSVYERKRDGCCRIGWHCSANSKYLGASRKCRETLKLRSTN